MGVTMAYFRYQVGGGEFVIQGDSDWIITFNGVRIGGLHACADDAVSAIELARSGKLVAPNLQGIASPPADLTLWQSSRGWEITD